MKSSKKPKDILGRSEQVDLPLIGLARVPARIDTGARTSSIWASKIKERDGAINFVLFDKTSPLYTGKTIAVSKFSVVAVASSNGHVQVRYKVPISINLKGRRIKTFCTLADRSSQAFPMLIGRNTLNGKFIVDVQRGSRMLDELEEAKHAELQSEL